MKRFIRETWMLWTLAILWCCAVFLMNGCKSSFLTSWLPDGKPNTPKGPCPDDGAATTYETLRAMAWLFIPLGIAGLIASHWLPMLKHIAGSILIGGFVCVILPWALDAIGVQLKFGAWGAMGIGVVFLGYWMTLRGMKLWRERKRA